MGLHALRPQPLLEPPGGSRGWWLPSGRDLEALGLALEKARTDRHGRDIAELVHHMRGLGVPVVNADDDYVWLRMEYERNLGGRDPHQLLFAGECAYYGKAVGHPISLDDRTREMIGKSIDEYDEAYRGNQANMGLLLMAARLSLVSGHMPRTYPPLLLDKARAAGDGYLVLWSHSLLKAGGEGSALTGGDEGVVRAALHKARGEDKSLMLAKILHHLRDVMPELPPEESGDPVPPLRRFTRPASASR